MAWLSAGLAFTTTRQYEGYGRAMKTTVSFSGGQTSAYLAYLMRDKADCFLFADTGFEHPKTYEFIKRVVQAFNIDLTCIRLLPNEEMGIGSAYEEIPVTNLSFDFCAFRRMIRKYGVPSKGAPFCTSKMKGEIMDKYRNNKFGKRNYITWRGIRIDEPKRLRSIPNVKYLADISDFTKEDIASWWNEQPFSLGIPAYLGNCIFCVKKSVNRIELARREHPEIADFLKTELNAARELEGRKNLGLSNQQIFYQHHSLDSIEQMFSGDSTEELLRRVRLAPTAPCEESCEPEEIIQMDIFQQPTKDTGQ